MIIINENEILSVEYSVFDVVEMGKNAEITISAKVTYRVSGGVQDAQFRTTREISVGFITRNYGSLESYGKNFICKNELNRVLKYLE